MAAQAIEKKDYRYFQQPVRLVFGKSLVRAAVTADLFEGVTSASVPFSPPAPYSAPAMHGTIIRLGGPWAFYRDFQPAHHLTTLGSLLPMPEVAVDAGSRLQIPVLIENAAAEPAEIAVTAKAPVGWKQLRGMGRYLVAGHGAYPFYLTIEVPPDAAAQWYEVSVHASGAEGAAIGDIRIRVHIESGALPQ
jgi:hypothetical protein